MLHLSPFIRHVIYFIKNNSPHTSGTDRTADKSILTFVRLWRCTISILQIFFFQLLHLYLLSSTEHIIYADISVYLKKEQKENRSSASGNQSLHDVGSKERQWERSVSHASYPPPAIPLDNPKLRVSLMFVHSFTFFFNCCSSLPFSMVSLSLLVSGPAVSLAADLRLMLALPVPLTSYQVQEASCLASHQTFQYWAPTGSMKKRGCWLVTSSLFSGSTSPSFSQLLLLLLYTYAHSWTLTCLCCCNCCCSSCSLSVSNTTGSTRIMKEVVPTQRAEREKLKQIKNLISFSSRCPISTIGYH